MSNQIDSTYQVTADDIERENRMTQLSIQIGHIIDQEVKQLLFNEYQQLHDQRSLEFIKHLEDQGGQ